MRLRWQCAGRIDTHLGRLAAEAAAARLFDRSYSAVVEHVGVVSGPRRSDGAVKMASMLSPAPNETTLAS